MGSSGFRMTAAQQTGPHSGPRPPRPRRNHTVLGALGGVKRVQRGVSSSQSGVIVVLLGKVCQYPRAAAGAPARCGPICWRGTRPPAYWRTLGIHLAAGNQHTALGADGLQQVIGRQSQPAHPACSAGHQALGIDGARSDSNCRPALDIQDIIFDGADERQIGGMVSSSQTFSTARRAYPSGQIVHG